MRALLLGLSARANILPSTPKGPKIRANDIVILILYAQGQIQRASTLSIVAMFFALWQTKTTTWPKTHTLTMRSMHVHTH
jgi:hypothetical protein